MMNRDMHKYKKLFLGVTLLICLLTGLGASAWAASTQVIEAEVIQDRARQFLTEQLTWTPDRMKLEILYKGGNIELPAGKVEYDFRLAGHKNRTGTVPFSLMILVDNVLKHRVSLLANVEVLYDVIQATRNLQRGHIIHAEDVKMVQVASSYPLNNIMTDIESMIGQEVVSTLRPGETVSSYMVRRVHVVKSGDRILLVAEKGPLRITAPGLVQENGFQDAIVRVENLHSNKTVYGTVINSKTVKVEF